MMGHREVEQAPLFYEFSLERHIPADHLLRSIDGFVDLDQVRQDLAPFYSRIGRPSIDPELMIRMGLSFRYTQVSRVDNDAVHKRSEIVDQRTTAWPAIVSARLRPCSLRRMTIN